LQFLLDHFNQVFDLLCGPGPEDEAISWVDEAGISLWSIEFCEDFIEDPALKFGSQYLLLLLLIPGSAMEIVACLD